VAIIVIVVGVAIIVVIVAVVLMLAVFVFVLAVVILVLAVIPVLAVVVLVFAGVPMLAELVLDYLVSVVLVVLGDPPVVLMQQAPSTPQTALPKAAIDASSSARLLNLSEGSLHSLWKRTFCCENDT
jgi:hypothetical protein